MKFELVSLGVVSLVVSLVACTEPVAPAVQGDVSNTLSSEEGIQAGSDATQSSLSRSQETADSYFPWTHKPVCTEYLDGIGDKLCVYTNATFSNGRGISIFTTPRIAQEFAALPPFQDPSSLSSRGINPEPSDDTPTQPWYTALIRGKGMGMLASRALQRGDLITAYTPYLLAHMENVLSTQDREYYLRLAVDQLPTASRNVYLGLAKTYNDPSVVAQDVVKANAFEIQIGGLMHLAVFPESSRFNHACAPNAQYFLSSDLLTHYVHAVRPIDEDEELTISYAPPLRLHADRQQYFENTFQFTCSCPRCAPESHGSHKHRTLEDSDRATQDIIALQWALAQWTANSTASVKKAEMLIRLYKEEGLDAFLDDAYGHAALMYNSVGSARGAKKYAKLAAEASWLKYGFESVGQDKVREWEGIARDPTRHSSWRSRKTEL
ncbi:hypothetical protein A1O7_08297 [Cladophialophora yegresii CBS 114405]|uniref:SET domain-containing protein n=1 Tax=Cladophialophora yegresii CBS 114405 TaxID=1182544 RepID=W9VQU7_9EURO|nr:uncharacterized protein A1O7_08297 [Cladophialophora yegresii CBS 114405]EXJ55370.1 hypothetical protein A1O7_08297 [Cladophialophora yegresii CBS 114405]